MIHPYWFSFCCIQTLQVHILHRRCTASASKECWHSHYHTCSNIILTPAFPAAMPHILNWIDSRTITTNFLLSSFLPPSCPLMQTNLPLPSFWTYPFSLKLLPNFQKWHLLFSRQSFYSTTNEGDSVPWKIHFSTFIKISLSGIHPLASGKCCFYTL